MGSAVAVRTAGGATERVAARPLPDGEDVDAYIQAHSSKSLLRFVMCGSVDDGKSTLIGRLLYECQALFADQLAAARGGLEGQRNPGGSDRLCSALGRTRR